MADALRRPLLLIAGVAEGLGASLAGTFASAGYDVAGIARSDRAVPVLRELVEGGGGTYTHLACDLCRPDAVAGVLQPYAGSVAVLVHNAHRLAIKPFADTSPDEFEGGWKTACLGAMTVARAVLPSMVARGDCSVIMTGATASVRGAANFAAFAAAKFALRGFTQSLAREYAPKGVHVVHVILDGLVDEPQTVRRFGSSDATRMNSQAIAQVYLDLVRQHPSAWTQELDLRPFSERF